MNAKIGNIMPTNAEERKASGSRISRRKRGCELSDVMKLGKTKRGGYSKRKGKRETPRRCPDSLKRESPEKQNRVLTFYRKEISDGRSEGNWGGGVPILRSLCWAKKKRVSDVTRDEAWTSRAKTMGEMGQKVSKEGEVRYGRKVEGGREFEKKKKSLGKNPYKIHHEEKKKGKGEFGTKRGEKKKGKGGSGKAGGGKLWGLCEGRESRLRLTRGESQGALP